MYLTSSFFSGRLTQPCSISICTLGSKKYIPLQVPTPLPPLSHFFFSGMLSGSTSPSLSNRMNKTKKGAPSTFTARVGGVAPFVGPIPCNDGISSLISIKRKFFVTCMPCTSSFSTSRRWQHNSPPYFYTSPVSSSAALPCYPSYPGGVGSSSSSQTMQDSAGGNYAYYSPYPLPPPPPPQWMGHHPQGPFPYGDSGNKMDGGTQLFGVPPPVSPSSSLPPLGSGNNPVMVSMGKRSWFMGGLSLGFGVFLFFTVTSFVRLFLFDNPTATLGEAGPDVSSTAFPSVMPSVPPTPVNLDALEVSFSTIRGCDEAKEELQELVAFLKNPEQFTSLGGRLPKGFLLVGPPGCGKTLLAKAIAKEANVKFFYATGSEFEEMFVGVGPRRIRDLFAAAKKNGPAVIFIDEIDAIAMKRSDADRGGTRMSLNQLLSEMDGFQSSSSVVVIAATNTPEALDKAILRPGRFDTIISIDPPDMKGRMEVLQLYLGKIKTDESVSAEEIAKGTTGFTGAELSNLVNMSAIRAATLQRTSVSSKDVDYAKDRIMMGLESKKVIPPEEKKIVAYHEGAHALAALLLQKEGTDPVHKATIIPRGNGVLGLVQQLPTKDRYSETKQQCLARIKVCLAGRIGEEMLLGDGNVTTGASSDLQKASEMARSMVRRFGFSNKLGVVFFESSSTLEGAYLADETKKKIDDEVNILVYTAYADTRKLLKENKEKLERIAQGLLERETLSGDELEKICSGETRLSSAPNPVEQIVVNSALSPSSSPSTQRDPGAPSSGISLDRCSVPIAQHK